MLVCAACSSERELRNDPNLAVCPLPSVWSETVVGNYWVNEELYTCKREAGQTVRLTDDRWHSITGRSQCMYYFPDERTVRVYRMVMDPAFWEKYGNAMVYSDHASVYDPVSGVWTLEGYDQIPKCPMTVTQVTANEFWTECPVTFPVPDGAFDLAIFRIRDRATAEAYVHDAVPIAEVELP